MRLPRARTLNQPTTTPMVQNCRAYLPSEWSPQSGVLLTWPHAHGDWGSDLGATENVFIELAQNISRFENVLIACYDDNHRQNVSKLLLNKTIDQDRIHLAVAPSNDVWVRDHGPITVICNDAPQLLDFQFNGWGNKFPGELNNALTRTLYHANVFGEVPMETINRVLEGGAIEVDGSGSLMATRRSLLSRSRNANITHGNFEQLLNNYFGIKRFLWLEYGKIDGDDTDSHIDNLARFCDRETIVYSTCLSPCDPNFAQLAAMQAELQSFQSITGKPYRLIPLPLPEPCHNAQGNRLPANYTNFVIINKAILVPTYNDPADTVALETLGNCFHGREIIGINALPLIQQCGSLHCVTMQLPNNLVV